MTFPTMVGRLTEQSLVRLTTLVKSVDRGQTDVSDVVIRSVSIVESYFEDVLRALIAHSGIDEIPFALAMRDELEDAMFRSWDERFKWMRLGFGVSVSGATNQQEFMTLVDLRNALVHGSGRLTPRQSRGVALLVEIEHRLCRVLDVEIGVHGLLLKPTTGVRAIAITRSFILEVDHAVRESHPSVRL